MDTKRSIIILAVLIGAGISFPTLAATIKLKSGKTVEGEIIEKTSKYIKIGVEGVPLTYYREDIESIEEQSSNLPSNGDYLKLIAEQLEQKQKQEKKYPAQDSNTIPTNKPSLSSAMDNASEWQIWYAKVNVYLDKITKLLSEAANYNNQVKMLIMNAKVGGDMQLVKDELGKIENSSDLLLSQLDALAPPSELTGFHQNVRQAVEACKSTISAVKEGKNNEVTKYARGATKAIRASYLELKNVFLQHNAPQKEIAAIDNTIKLFDNVIKMIESQAGTEY